jgi:acetoacetyl-CoA synthetase
MQWLRTRRGLEFADYDALWRWSVSDLDGFWGSLWEYFDIQSATPYAQVLARRTMPGAQWFPGATLNYTQHALRRANPDRPALLACGEAAGGGLREVSWAELEHAVRRFAQGLRNAGVGTGDRVAAYLPNIPEAVIAFLAAASLGAIWSSCSPDMGAGSVLDRLQQIQPKVLVAVDGYVYKGKAFDRRPIVAELEAKLTGLEQSVLVPYLDPKARPAASASGIGRRAWDDFLGPPEPLETVPVPFEHPLWVLYSSGTTGLPKPIVHSTGGILLEHMKALSLHLNLGPRDRFFWFTTTGWMMWNYLVGGLLVGTPIVLYDGSPATPDLGALWRLADDAGITCFGTSAAYIGALMSADYRPREHHALSSMVSLGSTGSPLAPEGYDWVYANVKRDVWLASVSGGTDVCAAFVGGNPLLPVVRGELQGRCLGCKVEAFDPDGRPLVDQVGELVVTEPMPSMPVGFWNDADGARYRESYFEMYPGVWRHGDWIKLTPEGGVCVYGRSDSTINRHGIRIGTSEIYSAVESVPGVVDSLVVDLEMLGESSYMPLFVVLAQGVVLDESLKKAINDSIRVKLSARQVPDEIVAIAEVPRTLNGKKMEVPVKKILLGAPADKAVSAGSMSNPESLRFFVEFAAARRRVPPRHA